MAGTGFSVTTTRLFEANRRTEACDEVEIWL
jgi:hypothetical protein